MSTVLICFVLVFRLRKKTTSRFVCMLYIFLLSYIIYRIVGYRYWPKFPYNILNGSTYFNLNEGQKYFCKVQLSAY